MSGLPEIHAVHGRPRGFITWSPRPETSALIETVRAILTEYRDYLPLTLRQVFYRLVGAHGYEKTERAYQRLCETLNRARRAQMIPFEDIRDDGFKRTGWLGWSGTKHFLNNIQNALDDYRIDRQIGQRIRLVVWCEATGMAPQLERVCERYSVPVFSSGGFDSVTVKHSIADEFAAMGRVLVLHIGDHDPSGVHLYLSLDEDVRAFLDKKGGSAQFIRLAVTTEQIDEYGLPTAPAKVTDRRAFTGETVQAEALPPDTLAHVLQSALDSNIDLSAYQHALALEQSQKRQLRARLSIGEA